jgi:membrane peptidoglycan carboxypeptidase
MDNVLQDISKQTGGRFTVSQAGREDWDVLYEEGIKKQAANGTQKDEERIWKELFVWPLGVGFLSFIGAYGVRVMGSGMILFFILCIQPVHAGEDILDPQDNRSMERFALSLYEDGDFRSAERLFIDLSVEGGARGIRDRARHNAALAAYQQGKLVEALRYLREMERSTPLSLHNAQQIAQEIEQRREQQPQQEESPSEQAESQEQNGSGGESGEESSSSSPSPKESPSSEENESQEQSTSTDPKSEEQNQSENNTKPESSSSEAPFSTEEKEGATGTPSPITNEEEGPEVEDLEGGVPNTPISGEAGGEIGDFSMEAFSLQEAGRLIDSVEEGENRGFGQGESDSSGTKEW